MSTPIASRRLRIGIDVGGTNTDGVLIDPLLSSGPDRGIIAWHKEPTTANPSFGINNALTTMLGSSSIRPHEVASVTIGTTQFVNAVVERDAARLSRVAVIRLCGPFSKHNLPCVDWPDDMRELILGHHALLHGGLEVDGRLISNIDQDEIKTQCSIIKQKGINSVVVVGIFSPIDTVERQEERAADIIKAEIPGCDVVCSKEVANLGFLERENAAILNASILPFARKTIRSFHEPVKRLGLGCAVFITQNDGTVLSGELAARLPIRTFSSGPTNSMRGAAFLVQGNLDEAMMVVDIGGTTSDVGILLENGFPRQQAAYSDLSGVRMNFSCPDIKSIGLGGGSIVRIDSSVSVGPDSVGYKLPEEAVVFGGNVLTATDCTVLANPELKIGDPALMKDALSEDQLTKVSLTIKRKLEKVIDTMKISPKDIPVILVGGGAVIAPDELKGASKVIKPQWSQVANAIGAAIARVSAVVDTVQSTVSSSTNECLDEVSRAAVRKTVEAGALRSTVKVVEKEVFPLQYIENKTRFIVRATGDFDFSKEVVAPDSQAEHGDHQNMGHDEKNTENTGRKHNTQQDEDFDILSYRPDVRNRTWYVSERDVSWIATGCYILGTGGGGSPYGLMIRLRTQLRNGAIIRVVNPEDLPDDARVGCGGGAGSPTVAIEKLAGDELLEAQQELYKMCNTSATHMISVEVGGANGLSGLLLGSSDQMDIPTVDGDWMGRAYPTKWQTTPVVFKKRDTIWSPIAVSDGNGNVLVMPKASSDEAVERIIRSALSEMGSQVGAADAPVTGEETKRWAVEHTLSQSWRIGRAVARARKENRVDNVAETIIEECGGPGAGKVLWKGKIIGVERTLRNGHVYGECLIEGADVRDEHVASGDISKQFKGVVKIPFKNENIAALRVHSDRKEELQEDILAIVPDLVCVIDAQNGEAVGTPEYRYGLLVVVLGIAASDRWTGTERGIKIGGPEAFGLGHLKFEPLGKYFKPRSVIDEFNK
ncbi:d-amino acid hydantoin hydrolase (hydantoinase) [Fusarium pseudoanthophilum]|uniref:D-amino acid hydantoin hydrolase (Hydantoinase) n=1 Tax=Fusarium pseudoanthophilum TaxID=48495 RepID=A0A8H5PPG4_9HYPO|nr:d-amino acid hydantoin hydrolase (hydantoinase) [Fusarium pseudoanthophilum]